MTALLLSQRKFCQNNFFQGVLRYFKAYSWPIDFGHLFFKFFFQGFFAGFFSRFLRPLKKIVPAVWVLKTCA